ncbi:hypothetical protein L1994_09130 [Methanomicrobium antiquum]|uniref:Uncharacterized protein n=1 Tax=Methanomicrobium antiquum TaxID=487686 RepID=A0AAF0JTH1_9EURY|nr:hypothetical protein [Methanomicrobium antiquum]WFN36298.1 hypothetical protein L1994_09130 [Methanomicrobium antiquum]
MPGLRSCCLSGSIRRTRNVEEILDLDIDHPILKKIILKSFVIVGKAPPI